MSLDDFAEPVYVIPPGFDVDAGKLWFSMECVPRSELSREARDRLNEHAEGLRRARARGMAAAMTYVVR